MPQTPSQVLHQTILNWIPRFDMEAFEIVVACVKAQEGDGVPVWMNVCAAPSSGKTVILDSFPTKPLPTAQDPVIKEGTLVIDSLTPRTLISGLANMSKPGLLERVENCALFIKDLSPLAASNESREVFSQLRRIFDGELAMPFGSGKSFSWSGRMTVVCASVSHLSSMDAELGGRLLSITLRPTEFSEKLAKRIATDRKMFVPMVDRVLCMMQKPTVTKEMFQVARSFARAIAICRTYIHHDYHNFQLHELPVQEQPHRLTTQLASLIAGLCSLRECKPQDTLPTVKRIVLETIPPYRRLVLAAIARSPKGCNMPDLIAEVRSSTAYKISKQSVRNTVDDLVILRLLDDEKKVPQLLGAPADLIERDQRWNWVKCIEKALAQYK